MLQSNRQVTILPHPTYPAEVELEKKTVWLTYQCEKTEASTNIPHFNSFVSGSRKKEGAISAAFFGLEKKKKKKKKIFLKKKKSPERMKMEEEKKEKKSSRKNPHFQI